jgi:hypothetical protein
MPSMIGEFLLKERIQPRRRVAAPAHHGLFSAGIVKSLSRIDVPNRILNLLPQVPLVNQEKLHAVQVAVYLPNLHSARPHSSGTWAALSLGLGVPIF